MYSAPNRCLYVHVPKEDSGAGSIGRGSANERRVSLRDLAEDDPAINEVAELVFTSSEDPDWIPRIRDGRLFFSISSAERFLDQRLGKGLVVPYR